MKGPLVFVAVVLAVLAVLPCWAVEPLAPVTCAQEDGGAAARLAMHHINEHHHHGYKFNLSSIESSSVEEQQGESECKVLLKLNLQETKCHTVNPKHFEDCELRDMSEGQVNADCNVTVAIKDGVAIVSEYDCDTERVMSPEELVRICPDCPGLLPLNDPQGLKSVQLAVRKFNKNVTNPRYYVLRDVGRMTSGYIMMTGMYYHSEVALVETHCPMGTRIVLEACKPLCPDRAHHTLCSSTSYGDGHFQLECEIYEPLNSTTLEQEPTCHHGHHPHQGPPSHTRPAHGPPPHAADRGLPSHGRPGPLPRPGPPHAGQGPPEGFTPPGHAGMPPFNLLPLHPLRPCYGAVQSDPAIHPICPWPRRHPNPRGSLANEGTPISS